MKIKLGALVQYWTPCIQTL